MNQQKIGRICEIQKNTYYVRCEGKETTAKLKGSFRSKEELPVVGDYVQFLENPAGDSLIASICPRKNIMKRPDQSGHAMGYVKNMVEQPMIANFDYVFIVTSLNEDYSYNRITRYCSHALQADAIPVVILTKADLCEDPEKYVSEVAGISEKVIVHAVSALTGAGLDALLPCFEPGKTIVLLGSSGAGKSTLINAIVGREVMKTGAIRQSDAKGRHTTTYRRLIELDSGVTLIDTPGMREIGMQNAAEGIEDVFADIRALESMCRFRDCRHRAEPGCAVRQAIADGNLSQERYELYLGLSRENKHNNQLKKQIAIRKKQMMKR